MGEWKKYKLKDVCTILGDGLHGTPIYDDKGEFFFINGNNLKDGRISIKNDTKRVPYSEANKYKKPLNNRTILVSINGTIGNVAKYQDEKCILGKSACFFNVKENVDLNFIYYVVVNQQFKNTITQLATGTTIKNVSLETMRNYTFCIPPLSIQKQIGKILSSLDDKIELNRRINDNLERQAQVLFKSWFVDFEPFKKGKFIDSELGMIPEGWQVEKLGNITNSITEKVGKRTDIKVLSPVNTGDLLLSEEYFTKQVYSKNLAKYIMVAPNDFAYNPARINIGSIGMNTFDFSGCVSPVYVVFRCEKEYHHFFNIFKATKNFKEEVNTRAIGGVRQTLSYKDFSLIKIVYPTKEAVEQFNKIYSHIMTLIKKNGLENKRLYQTRDTLLPKLMSGELKINDINN